MTSIPTRSSSAWMRSRRTLTSRPATKDPATFGEGGCLIVARRIGGRRRCIARRRRLVSRNQNQQGELLERLLRSAARPPMSGLQRRASQTRWWRASLHRTSCAARTQPWLFTSRQSMPAADRRPTRCCDPSVQALEARWRGVRRLVETLELGDSLELRIFDVGKDALIADLPAGGRLRLEADGSVSRDCGPRQRRGRRGRNDAPRGRLHLLRNRR